MSEYSLGQGTVIGLLPVPCTLCVMDMCIIDYYAFSLVEKGIGLTT